MGLLTTAYNPADAMPAPPAELIFTAKLNLGVCHQLFDEDQGLDAGFHGGTRFERCELLWHAREKYTRAEAVATDASLIWGNAPQTRLLITEACVLGNNKGRDMSGDGAPGLYMAPEESLQQPRETLRSSACTPLVIRIRPVENTAAIWGSSGLQLANDDTIYSMRAHGSETCLTPIVRGRPSGQTVRSAPPHACDRIESYQDRERAKVKGTIKVRPLRALR